MYMECGVCLIVLYKCWFYVIFVAECTLNFNVSILCTLFILRRFCVRMYIILYCIGFVYIICLHRFCVHCFIASILCTLFVMYRFYVRLFCIILNLCCIFMLRVEDLHRVIWLIWSCFSVAVVTWQVDDVINQMKARVQLW